MTKAAMLPPTPGAATLPSGFLGTKANMLTKTSAVPGYYPQPQPVTAQSPRSLSFVIGVVIVFFLFSRAAEFIDDRGRFHLISIFVLVGIVALLMAGTLKDAISARPGFWLTLFTAWLTFSLPFSKWRGGTFSSFTNIWLKSFVFFFLIAGLIFSIEQFRKTVFWLAMATISVMYYTYKSGGIGGDERFSISYGTLGNSNDLAGSLLMGVPFLLYVAIDKRRNAFFRIACAVLTLVSVALIFRTGSRGGLLATGCLAVLAFFKTNMANKFKMLVLFGIVAAIFPFVVSKSLLARYATILNSDARSNDSSDVASAIESTNARRGLMKQGFLLTLYNPLFGVGLGNFSPQSADLFVARGEPALWFTCHDIFLLVSSETGLPGFFCYMAVIVACYKILLRLQKQSRSSPVLRDISDIAFCLMVSLTAFLVCGIFSTSAYTFQLPMLAGLTAALERVSRPFVPKPDKAALRFGHQNAIAVAPRFRQRPVPPALA